MITYITPLNRQDHISKIETYQEIRHKVFKDRLDWDVTTSNNREYDGFDHKGTVYIIYQHDETKRVIGGVRLLPTFGNYMLKNVFLELMPEQSLSISPYVWESSRYCVDTTLDRKSHVVGFHQGTLELFAGMLQFGLINQLQKIVTVTDYRIKKILSIVGWSLQDICPIKEIGGVKTLAGYLPIKSDYLTSLIRLGKIKEDFVSNEKEGQLVSGEASLKKMLSIVNCINILAETGKYTSETFSSEYREAFHEMMWLSR